MASNPAFNKRIAARDQLNTELKRIYGAQSLFSIPEEPGLEIPRFSVGLGGKTTLVVALILSPQEWDQRDQPVVLHGLSVKDFIARIPSSFGDFTVTTQVMTFGHLQSRKS